MPAACRLHDELRWEREETASPGKLSSSHGGAGLPQTHMSAWSGQQWMDSPSERLWCAGTCTEQSNVFCVLRMLWPDRR